MPLFLVFIFSLTNFLRNTVIDVLELNLLRQFFICTFITSHSTNHEYNNLKSSLFYWSTFNILYVQRILFQIENHQNAPKVTKSNSRKKQEMKKKMHRIWCRGPKQRSMLPLLFRVIKLAELFCQAFRSVEKSAQFNERRKWRELEVQIGQTSKKATE